jgi:hypothetical protein
MSDKRAPGVPRVVPRSAVARRKNAPRCSSRCSSSHSTSLMPLTRACVKQADQGKRRDPETANAGHFQLVNPPLTMVVSSRRLTTCRAVVPRSKHRFARL